MKWYAYYGGSSEYELLSEKEREEHLKELMEDPELNCEQITFMKYAYNEYGTFSEAKKYLLMHLEGELSELKWAVKELKRRRAK